MAAGNEGAEERGANEEGPSVGCKEKEAESMENLIVRKLGLCTTSVPLYS